MIVRFYQGWFDAWLFDTCRFSASTVPSPRHNRRRAKRKLRPKTWRPYVSLHPVVRCHGDNRHFRANAQPSSKPARQKAHLALTPKFKYRRQAGHVRKQNRTGKPAGFYAEISSRLSCSSTVSTPASTENYAIRAGSCCEASSGVTATPARLPSPNGLRASPLRASTPPKCAPPLHGAPAF